MTRKDYSLRDRPAETGEALNLAFFKTITGPDGAPYPSGGAITVYHGQKLKNVRFPQAIGTGVLTFDETLVKRFIRLRSPGSTITQSSVVLCANLNGMWFVLEQFKVG